MCIKFTILSQNSHYTVWIYYVIIDTSINNVSSIKVLSLKLLRLDCFKLRYIWLMISDTSNFLLLNGPCWMQTWLWSCCYAWQLITIWTDAETGWEYAFNEDRSNCKKKSLRWLSICSTIVYESLNTPTWVKVQPHLPAQN